MSDDGECELAAVGCLDAIRKIVESPLDAEVYGKLEEVILPLINYSLNEDNSEFA